MHPNFKTADTFTYDDVLLVPQYSDIESRKEVSIKSWLDQDRGLSFELPVIASPMDTICETEMAILMARMGGLGIVHRYNTVDRQCQIAETIFENVAAEKVGFAIGITGDYLERAKELVKLGARILCVDVAHGDHILVRHALTRLRTELGNAPHIMAGNVATLEGFDHLAAWGANSIRVGIGGGSICSTRIQTGHGVPSLSSIIDCRETQHNVAIIADGGIKNSGDIVKALAGGADFGMVGSLLAGTDETPGKTFISPNGEKRKVYRGMASKDAQMDWRGKASSLEGISTSVAYKGSARDIIEQLDNGIRSGFSYSGARNIHEFWLKAKFIRQSNAASYESNTHILNRNG
jgi:IMP dehydrogenase